MAWLFVFAAPPEAACKDAGDGRAQIEATTDLVAPGRMLFFDTGLSADGQVACASCHKPERAYSDGLARAAGVLGREGTRNAPSLLDVGRQRSFFWDGRRVQLEDQALDPLLNQVEHGPATRRRWLGSALSLATPMHSARPMVTQSAS